MSDKLVERAPGTRPPVFAFLDGPSAAGKTTIAFEICRLYPAIKFIPRMTTRPMRPGLDESEYQFVLQQEFERLRDTDAFIEYREYEFGMAYGLPREAVERSLAAGNDTLAIVNLGRAEEVKSKYPRALAILLQVPERTIRRRLEQRGTHTDAQIAERLRNAKTTNPDSNVYDLVVRNEGPISEAAQRIVSAVRIWADGV